MEEKVLCELEKYRLRLTTLWQENEVSTTATRPTIDKTPLSFTASPFDLSESYVPLEPAFEKQLLPKEEVQDGQECQNLSSFPPRRKLQYNLHVGNTKVVFLTSIVELYIIEIV